MLQESVRSGTLRTQPGVPELLVARSPIRAGRNLVERGIARRVDREAHHTHALHFLLARLIMVRPSAVVERAGGEHGHVDLRCKQFGNPSSERLGAAVHLDAVPLDYDRKPQDSAAQ
jgi:hypothetical protein